MTEQTSLFSAKELRTARYLTSQPHLEMSQDALQDWKQRVFQYQQQVNISATTQQGSLFDLVPTVEEIAEAIDPFQLPQQNTEFWRWKAEDRGVAAFYFVIDYTLPILLYVGETVKSNQRWKGEHDCNSHLALVSTENIVHINYRKRRQFLRKQAW
jgi:hypothetical protein